MSGESEVPARKQIKRTNNARLSKDGKWRLFPQDSHLLQYVGTGMFYGRVKVDGKIVRRKLDTKAYTTAKLKLLDFLKEHRTSTTKPQVKVPTWAEAKKLYEIDLDANPAYSPKTVDYKRFVLKLIERTWPELTGLTLDRTSRAATLDWAARLAKEVSAQAYNLTLGVFRDIFERGLAEIPSETRKLIDFPGASVKRLGVPPKKLRLPEATEFNQLVQTVRSAGGGFSGRAADLIQFLAFTGCRLSEAKAVRWRDVDWIKNEIVVKTAKRKKTSSSETVRRVPIISPLKELLDRLKADLEDAKPDETICRVFECQKSMENACAKLQIPRITHHDLRHLFATRCIESGVDIPTVARWLGHRDGGALAMKTYGHLRNEHSQAMAAKVKF